MTVELPTLLGIGAEPPQQGQKPSNPGIFTAKFLQALLHFLNLHRSTHIACFRPLQNSPKGRIYWSAASSNMLDQERIG